MAKLGFKGLNPVCRGLSTGTLLV